MSVFFMDKSLYRVRGCGRIKQLGLIARAIHSTQINESMIVTSFANLSGCQILFSNLAHDKYRKHGKLNSSWVLLSELPDRRLVQLFL